MRETGTSGSATRDAAKFELKQIKVTEATKVGAGPLAAKPRIVYPKSARGSDKNRIATTKRALRMSGNGAEAEKGETKTIRSARKQIRSITVAQSSQIEAKRRRLRPDKAIMVCASVLTIKFAKD